MFLSDNSVSYCKESQIKESRDVCLVKVIGSLSLLRTVKWGERVGLSRLFSDPAPFRMVPCLVHSGHPPTSKLSIQFPAHATFAGLIVPIHANIFGQPDAQVPALLLWSFLHLLAVYPTLLCDPHPLFKSYSLEGWTNRPLS